MGLRTIKMPDVGEGVTEAEIVEWHVKVGDPVQEDQPVAAVMTDKATVEIPTPVAGTVVALGGAVGEVLAVGSELFRIDAPGLPDQPAAPPSKGAAKAAAPAGAREARLGGTAPSPSSLEPSAVASGGRRPALREGRRPRRPWPLRLASQDLSRAARRARRERSRSPRPPCGCGRASRGRPAFRPRLGSGRAHHPRRSRRLHRPSA